ncbi:MAG: class I SAM-dependent methyltransferase [Sphingomonas sp.]|uniref:class I SAM-dependent methyltransferase n=1 Tax=Sphingomonas sp. TaxID=28214 RepID=UPI001ACE97E9|nr:class I SAM-dependent methyltransferase [Sphingomonas sp.]MBN8816733.1 class I SAM-dependent methyltransferase [Sphingomonas sp.]
MFTEASACRLCGGTEFTSVMDLGNQVLTGVFPKTRDQKVDAGPVELIRCSVENGCGLVQLRQSYDVSQMYGENYGYRSGLNSSMVKHLQGKIQKIVDMGILQPGDVIIDIGSNDATSLRAYPDNGYQLFGVDPTGTKFREYYTDNITLVPDFFSAAAIHGPLNGQKAKVVTSFSMFYDLEDPAQFAREVAGALHDDGVWVFEQSYLPAMLRANSFDTICHEHLEFYALKQIEWIAREAGLKVIDVEFNDINGGSFSIVAAKQNSKRQPNEAALNAIRADEDALGLDGDAVYEAFKERVEVSRKATMAFFEQAKAAGETVYGLGASTKGNVLLQEYGINDSHITAIGEVNEDKFGSFTPGSLIPLMSEAEVLALNPDYLFVLPWHFRPFFEQLPSLKGRKLVFPLPNFEVVQL